MELFSFVVTYSDGSIEDLTAKDGSTAEDIHRDLDVFMNESTPGSWNKIVIMGGDQGES